MAKFETRSFKSNLTIRADAEQTESTPKVIEGYFAVTESETELYDGVFEKITKGAFKEAVDGKDIRALINHDTKSVLGRTTAGTLELQEDDKGLYGKIYINENDTEALNLYSRVKRGDVTQCSIGFIPIEIAEEWNAETNELHWIIKKLDLYEVSVVTFPAYEETGVEARAKRSKENYAKKSLEIRKKQAKGKLKHE